MLLPWLPPSACLTSLPGQRFYDEQWSVQKVLMLLPCVVLSCTSDVSSVQLAGYMMWASMLHPLVCAQALTEGFMQHE